MKRGGVTAAVEKIKRATRTRRFFHNIGAPEKCSSFFGEKGGEKGQNGGFPAKGKP